jgi:hypothetical protein
LVVGGQEDDQRIRMGRLDQRAQIKAAAVREVDVQKHQVIEVGREFFFRFPEGQGTGESVTVQSQVIGEGFI